MDYCNTQSALYCMNGYYKTFLTLTIPVASLVIAVLAVLVLSCRQTNRQTDRQTDRHTDADERFTCVTVVLSARVINDYHTHFGLERVTVHCNQ